MARGGRRKGTPGVAYSNRTDLMGGGQQPGKGGYNPAEGLGSPASGGVQSLNTAPTAGVDFPAVEDTPNLTDPTQRPNEPVTTGLPSGPGAGPEVLNLDPRTPDLELLRRTWLPTLEMYARSPDTPKTVRRLVAYIRHGG